MIDEKGERFVNIFFATNAQNLAEHLERTQKGLLNFSLTVAWSVRFTPGGTAGIIRRKHDPVQHK